MQKVTKNYVNTPFYHREKPVLCALVWSTDATVFFNLTAIAPNSQIDFNTPTLPSLFTTTWIRPNSIADSQNLLDDNNTDFTTTSSSNTAIIGTTSFSDNLRDELYAPHEVKQVLYLIGKYLLS